MQKEEEEDVDVLWSQNALFQSCLTEDLLFANQVRSLERVLRVRERLSHPSPGLPTFPPCDKVSCTSVEYDLGDKVLVPVATPPVRCTASSCGGETDLGNAELVVLAPPPVWCASLASAEAFRVRKKRNLEAGIEDVRADRAATASESEGNIGLLESDFPSLSNSVNSCPELSTSACARASRVARAVAPAGVCLGSSSSAESAAAAHAHASTLHGARNSGGTGGLCLCRGPPVTAWTYVARVKRGRRVPKVGFPVQPKICSVSKVEAGVIFRPAGSVRGQVVGYSPEGSGEVRSHLPSSRRFLVPNSRHLDVDWASGNQWAGRRCVIPLSRGSGC